MHPSIKYVYFDILKYLLACCDYKTLATEYIYR